MSTVTIMDADYENCHETVETIFRLFPLEITGKKVVIKPNVLRAAAPEEALTTHPAVLKAVVAEVLKRCPASLIVGDNSGVFSYGMNEEAFRITGLKEAAGSYYRNLGMETVSKAINSPYLERALVSKDILDADIYISLPKFKTHGLTGLSCAIKNNFGLLVGALKAQTHQKAGNPANFAEALIEVFALKIPDLVIVDGILAMEGNGPASKDLINLGKIIAGVDPVAIDTVVAYMMGFPSLPRTVELAAARGFGTGDLSKITVEGKLETIPGFKLPQTNPVGVHALDSIATLKPQVDKAACTLCGTCIDHCPNGALTLNEFPVVDRALCITCFCCQELCPQKAIELK